jgi:N-acetylglucosaminyldiphosphoundecaprenol N-acetyl-beta-D-mannosaminyltransferase
VMKIDEVHILGAKVNRVTMAGALKIMDEFISDDRKHQICVPNVWTTVLSQKDEEFKGINNSSSMAIPDGMPLVWVSRLLFPSLFG